MSTPIEKQGKIERLGTHRKALALNLDQATYGTIAEIGAGQEVSNWFFRVGATSGSIAKTMSAYDMKFSDEIYGQAGRYVSRERVIAMLDHEYELLETRLSGEKAKVSTFFAYADTISARNFYGTNIPHGWVGVSFQGKPEDAPSTVVLHLNLRDSTSARQQQALGVFGVNLIYAAFYKRENPSEFLKSLLDDLSVEQIEVDYIEFYGPEFEDWNHAQSNLALLRNGLCNVIAFCPDGTPCDPMSILYKRRIVIERGTFRVVRKIHTEMLKAGIKRICEQHPEGKREPMAVLETTINNLSGHGDDDETMLARVRELLALGYHVAVTAYAQNYHLTQYLKRYTQEPIRYVLGISNLVQIFDEQYYRELDGGIVMAMGRLFSADVKLYVFSMKKEAFLGHLKAIGIDPNLFKLKDDKSVSIDSIRIKSELRHLYDFLRAKDVFVEI